MKVRHFLAGLLLNVLLSACAAIRGGGDVDQGRQALLAGNYFKPPSAIFRLPSKQTPTTCTVRNYGKEF
ncbi:MAG TPA: hypothetical protein VFF31_10030 [Blastocatellia bacterium]|nr:hypothetical protein [Blastocatellia bacterium]